jgi:hypothetical protein
MLVIALLFLVLFLVLGWYVAKGFFIVAATLLMITVVASALRRNTGSRV